MEKEEGTLNRKSSLNIFIVKTITVLTHQDINVKIIGFCDPNDQEKCGNFWMNILRTLYPLGLNYKQINHY